MPTTIRAIESGQDGEQEVMEMAHWHRLAPAKKKPLITEDLREELSLIIRGLEW